MLNKQKQQQIVCLINCGTPEQDYNFLKHSGGIVQGIFAKIGPDLELRWGDLISSPVDSIVSLVSPKKSYRPNSVGKNYFSATSFSLLAKNATGGHNA